MMKMIDICTVCIYNGQFQWVQNSVFGDLGSSLNKF